jgi:signal transduction histidine kinase
MNVAPHLLPDSTDYTIIQRRVRWLRFALPITMGLMALAFEVWEHWLEGEPWLDPIWVTEVFIFAVAGPLAFFLGLTYVEHLLLKLHKAHVDITLLNQDLEQKVAARTAELEQANTRLQELNQMKSDFVSLVSHELRAPLATLNGGLEVALQHQAQIPARAQRILQLLLGETARLTEFVQTILDVGQLEAGKLRVHCGPAALKPLLRQAVDVTLGADAARVVWRVPADVPPIWIDETYTEEIIRNLLRNAQKYTPPGSPIELKATVEQNALSLCVTDYGPGIPPERQAQVFERFGRWPQENGGSDQPRGWGLGLYFAHMLLARQGGSLSLQSPAHADADAPGCRFVLRLPLAQAEEALYGEAAAD